MDWIYLSCIILMPLVCISESKNFTNDITTVVHAIYWIKLGGELRVSCYSISIFHKLTNNE